ncbi:MAG: hypothetical protein HY695_06120 [Deltaproteobacteria bacterium]|nr:hypothetical protein [Deltaproteobacteria bacterium]
MKQQRIDSKDPDIRASEKALRRAARRALELGIQTGTAVYVLQHGEIVDLTKKGRVKGRTKELPKRRKRTG